MRIAGFLAVFAVTISILLSPALSCGDKFLVNSKGVQQKMMLSSSDPGRVLLFKNPNSELAKSVLNDELTSRLSAAGHSVTVLESMEELEAAMKSGGQDIIVLDVADARALNAAGGPRPVLLPIVGKKAKDEVKAAKNEFGEVLKAPGRTSYVVLLVHETVRKAKKASS